MSKGNYMCALRSFFLDRFLQYPTPTNQSFTSSHHRRHCPRAFDHGGGRGFLHLRTPTPPRKGGGSPLSNHGWPAHHPTKPCLIRAKITSGDQSPHPVRGRDKNRWAPLSVRWSWAGVGLELSEEKGVAIALDMRQ